jgi:formate C-acetyltransferase
MKSSLPAHTLSDYTLDDFPLLKALRAQNLKAQAEVCIERARWITRSLRQTDEQSPPVPMSIRYARAVKEFLSHKEPCFFDDNLLAGTTTSKPFGAPVYPELTGLTVWPELDTISRRAKNAQKLDSQDAKELNLEVFPYWLDDSILEATRKREGNPPHMRLFEKIVFFLAGKAGAISHTVPCYRIALEKGVGFLVEEARRSGLEALSSADPSEKEKGVFYESMATALEGIVAYAERLSLKASQLAANEPSPQRRMNLEALSSVCGQVPAKPARSFREAVNSLWLLQVAIHAENINMAVSPGRLDQILYPWYRNDIEAGTLSEREALELIGSLWLKFNDNTNLVPETAEELFGGAGTVPAVTLGGVDQQGEDAVNELTYLMLKVTEMLKTRDPSVNARYHPGKNSPQYLRRVAETVKNTRSAPAFYNDLSAIATLTNQGVSLEHARDYAVIGCVELSASGRSYDASSSIMLNLVAALEMALYNGKRPITGDSRIGPATGEASSFAEFADFEKAFRSQLAWLIDQAVKVNEALGRTHQQKLPTPLLSALFEGPLEKGKDLIFGGALYNASGATHIGFADTVDSLSAIEQGVFIDRRFSLGEVVEALQNDFQGKESLRSWLANHAPKYGTADPVAAGNSSRLLKFLYETYQGYLNYRGGRYRPAFWTMTNHAGQGSSRARSPTAAERIPPSPAA